jgi:predicted DCC family thiol-disulfide oxidoreductase YuxK
MLSDGRQAGDPTPPCVLIYDGECRLCVGTKRKLEQSPPPESGQVRFIPYQSEEAKQALGSRYRAGRPEMAFLVEPSGLVREGLDAFMPLLTGYPGGRVLVRWARAPFVRRVLTRLYRSVARHRYRWFGSVPPPR